MAGVFGDFNFGGWPGPGSIQREFFEANPSAAYQRLLGQMGLIFEPERPFAKFAESQREPAYQTYLAELGGRPNPEQYSYVDFLDDWRPRLTGMWGNLSAAQRGERFPGGVGRARWVGWSS